MLPMLKEILSTLQPNPKAQSVAKEVQSSLQELNNEITFVIGGSLAKNTHLKGNHDCDIFARFPLSYKDQELSDHLEKTLQKSPYTFERVHGSRDYFQCTIKGVDFEVVPVFAIDKASKAQNVTDCSYLHILWTNAHTKKTIKGLPIYDHIRLAKKFCKAQRVYGAESYISGISGHVVDILVIHFGGFDACIQNIAKWNLDKKIVIDTTHAYKDPELALTSLNEAKTLAPLIVVDPVDNLRNAAAALSKKQLGILINACKAYVQRPTKSAFTTKKITLQNVTNLPSYRCEIHLQPLVGKKDVVGAKMLKAAEHIKKESIAQGFTCIDFSFYWEDSYATCYVSFAQQKIPKSYEHQGPPITHERAESFTQKHPNTYIKDGRFYTQRKREFSDVKKLLEHLLVSTYVQNKTESAQLVNTYTA